MPKGVLMLYSVTPALWLGLEHVKNTKGFSPDLFLGPPSLRVAKNAQSIAGNRLNSANSYVELTLF